MNRLVIGLLVIVFSGFGYCQPINSTESIDSSCIYSSALKIYLEHVKEQLFDSVLIEENSITTSCLTNDAHLFSNVRVVDDNELFQRFITTEELQLLRIIPLRFDKEYFYVNVLLYEVRKEDVSFVYTLVQGEGAKIVYSFDCLVNQFVFQRIEM